MEEFNQYQFPESYKENSRKEKLTLAHAENFRRQYVHLYRDRKPLFLNPVNESNVEVRIYSLDYYSLQLFLHIPLPTDRSLTTTSIPDLCFIFFQKFVCTSIRPTQLPYQELYDWDGAAEFVADYLDFVPLDPPYELVLPFGEIVLPQCKFLNIM